MHVFVFVWSRTSCFAQVSTAFCAVGIFHCLSCLKLIECDEVFPCVALRLSVARAIEEQISKTKPERHRLFESLQHSRVFLIIRGRIQYAQPPSIPTPRSFRQFFLMCITNSNVSEEATKQKSKEPKSPTRQRPGCQNRKNTHAPCINFRKLQAMKQRRSTDWTITTHHLT